MTAPTREIWLLTGEFERELASGLRQERWAQAALNAGARVRVMNLRGAFGFVSSLFTSREEVARFRRRDPARTAKPSIREGALVPLLRRIKHTLFVDLYYPSVMRLATHVLSRLARTTEPVAIMASSPPFSLAIVGAIAKRLWPRRVHLVVDMRDAWAMHSYLMGSRTIRRALERWVLRSADQVLTVSQGLCDEFAATHGVQVGLVYNVATHYFDNNGARAGLDWKSLDPAIDADAIKLVYTGSTPEGFYDLAGAAEAIAEVGNKGNLPRRFQFVLAGACQGLTDELRKRQLGPAQFVFIGHQPHSVARALQSECDALVFFAHVDQHGAGGLAGAGLGGGEAVDLHAPIIARAAVSEAEKNSTAVARAPPSVRDKVRWGQIRGVWRAK